MNNELNAKEIAALQYIADGLPNKAIAEKVGYTHHSLNGYLSGLYAKMGVRTRTEAAVMALRKGIVH
jgi:DNA-binding CsgD family transcriptional regulator